MNLMNSGFIPLSLEDSALMPTDCVKSPSFVKRSTRAMIIMQIMAMKIGVGTGMPGMKFPK